MLSTRAAAALLADRSATAPEALCAALGIAAAPLPLDDAALGELGLDGIARGRIARGAGALRALLVELDDERPLREWVRRIASHLAARTPHLLWLLVARHRRTGELAVAAWSAERATPRTASLAVHPERVVASDAETVAALAAAAQDAAGDDDPAVHARWIEILGRDALTRRFYRALERLVDALAASASGRATPAERREIALLAVSRLLFLSFLQAKGWMDGDHDFLARTVSRRLADGGDVHRRCLLPLFFGTLNTPPRRRAATARAFGRVPFLNGGLFTPAAVERRCRDLRFPDEPLGALFDEVLLRYRFTARESAGDWSEAAVDPAMLGRAFESLMADAARRTSGAFYTPQALVERLADAALRRALCEGALPDAGDALAGRSDVPAPLRAALLARLDAVRVLDPACGSGAFLVHVLERLAELRARAGDGRPVAARRRAVLARSIFGVDVNPMAVWLCELRLWLSVSVEDEETDPLRVRPLPNLDRNVRVGDALSGEVRGADGAGRAIARLRERYARATGPGKRGLARALDAVERRRALDALARDLASVAAARRELALLRRARDLFGERHRAAALESRASALRASSRDVRSRARALREGAALPFAWHTHFADAVADGGFDVVVGNPPWVRLHRIPAAERASLRARFSVFRDAAWRDGVEPSRGGAGFGAQADLAALFVERALALTRPGGVLAFVLPAKLWRSLAGGGVRARLLADAVPLRIEDWSAAVPSFEAAVYPSLLLVRRAGGRDGGTPSAETDAARERGIDVAVRVRGSPREWRLSLDRLPLDDSRGSPWLLLPSEVRAAFDRLAGAGPPLAAGRLRTPLLGVKSGCNGAFAVGLVEECGELARVRAADREGVVESRLLRPLLRGEAVRAWRAEHDGERLLWTHGDDRRPLERLPPHAARWLAPWRGRLSARVDAHGRERWWSLFRTEAADASRVRVVWADIGRTPAAAVLEAGDPTVPLNSCYVLRCENRDDALALAALLNGPLAAAWLRALAEPARGGYARFLAWTVGRLPLPREWARARELLAPLGERGVSADAPSAAELLDGALASYGLACDDVEPLLAWSDR